LIQEPLFKNICSPILLGYYKNKPRKKANRLGKKFQKTLYIGNRQNISKNTFAPFKIGLEI
jgi:hypothetical protein